LRRLKTGGKPILKKTLSILARLLLMAGFFLGLFLTVRIDQWWHLLAGPFLMLITVPLNDLATAYGQDRPPESVRLVDAMRRSAVFILPIVLFIVSISGVFLAAQYASRDFFLLYLLAGIPMFTTLARAVKGELPWSFVPLATAFSRLVTFQLGYMMLVLGTVFLALVVGIMGTIVLLITLGNLVWQWLADTERTITPFFCTEFGLGDGTECVLTLAGLHGLQLLTLFVTVKYGDRLFNAAADWVNSYRD
jgi:hypothetical protein